MKIKRHYYDEKLKILDEIRQEMNENLKETMHDKNQEKYEKREEKFRELISETCETEEVSGDWNPQENSDFMFLVEKLESFARTAGCNLEIKTEGRGNTTIRIQTDGIWLLCDGETSVDEKEMLADLLHKADYVYMGTGERDGKTVVELQLGIQFI